MEIDSYKVYKEPNWEYELVSCILEKDGKREAKAINERALFQPQKEVEDLLQNIRSYKERVLEEVLPLLDHYPDIKPYFEVGSVEKDNRARPILANLTSQRKLSGELTREEIDILIQEAFENYAKMVKEELQDGISIGSLTELISFLKEAEAEDSLKLRLILFYTERYSVIPQIQKFLAEGIAVLQKYYPDIREEFQKAVATMEDKRNMEIFMDKLGIIKLGKCNSMVVQPCIMTFNQIAVDWKDEDGNNIIVDTGIYIFRLDDMMKNNVLSDSKIVNGLKALGDATRIKMIHMLSGKKMYIQEIADQLSLTPATVSHHINVLLQEGLVCVTVDVERAKKVYYELNSERFKDLGEAVKQLGILAESKTD